MIEPIKLEPLGPSRFRTGPEKAVSRYPEGAGYTCMVIVLDGTFNMQMGPTRYTALPGQVALRPQNVPLEEWNGDGKPLECLLLPFYWHACPRDLPRVVDDRQGRIRALAERMIETDLTAAPAQLDWLRQYALCGIVAEFSRAAVDPADRMVRRTEQFMLAHLAEPLTISRMAGHVNLSPSYFIRRYHRLSGRTPMETLRHLRVMRARDLLLSTSLTLYAIAVEVGITDEYYLSRLIKRYCQSTPTQLRRRRV